MLLSNQNPCGSRKHRPQHQRCCPIQIQNLRPSGSKPKPMKKPGRLHRASMFTFSNRTGGHGSPRKAKDRKTRIALSSVFVAARRDRKRFDGAGVVRSLLYPVGGQLHLWTCCLVHKTTSPQDNKSTVVRADRRYVVLAKQVVQSFRRQLFERATVAPLSLYQTQAPLEIFR